MWSTVTAYCLYGKFSINRRKCQQNLQRIQFVYILNNSSNELRISNTKKIPLPCGKWSTIITQRVIHYDYTVALSCNSWTNILRVMWYMMVQGTKLRSNISCLNTYSSQATYICIHSIHLDSTYSQLTNYGMLFTINKILHN